MPSFSRSRGLLRNVLLSTRVSRRILVRYHYKEGCFWVASDCKIDPRGRASSYWRAELVLEGKRIVSLLKWRSILECVPTILTNRLIYSISLSTRSIPKIYPSFEKNEFYVDFRMVLDVIIWNDVTNLVELLNVGISRIIAQFGMVTLNSFKPSVIKKVAPSLARFVILTVANQHRAFHNLDYPHSQKEKVENRRKRKNMTNHFWTWVCNKKIWNSEKNWIRLTLRFQKICTENNLQIKPTQVLEDKEMKHKNKEKVLLLFIFN